MHTALSGHGVSVPELVTTPAGTPLRTYEAGLDSECRPRVLGPGDGMGYYSGTLWPNLTCGSPEEAKRMAAIANIAYREGWKSALSHVNKALNAPPPCK